MNEQERKELFGKVASALKHFLGKDWQLLEINSSERSIAHKLAEHLQRQFPDWHVDCEYNRFGKDAIKTLPRILFESIREDEDEAKTIFPDIIVHKRTTDNNLIVIELKKANGSRRVNSTTDEIKLKAFTAPEGRYKYNVGLFIVFDVESQTVSGVRLFESGLGVTLDPVFQAELEALGYGD